MPCLDYSTPGTILTDLCKMYEANLEKFQVMIPSKDIVPRYNDQLVQMLLKNLLCWNYYDFYALRRGNAFIDSKFNLDI